jgi:hypothetical protein
VVNNPPRVGRQANHCLLAALASSGVRLHGGTVRSMRRQRNRNHKNLKNRRKIEKTVEYVGMVLTLATRLV